MNRGDYIGGQAQRFDDGRDIATVANRCLDTGLIGKLRDQFSRAADDARLFGAVVVIFRLGRGHLAELYNVPVQAITVIIRADFGPVARPDSNLGMRA